MWNRFIEPLEARGLLSAGPLATSPLVVSHASQAVAQASLKHSSTNSLQILNVPAYRFWYGCLPTSVGMIMGYWAAHGYPDLVRGDPYVMTQAVKNMIASPAHIISGQENRPFGKKYVGDGDWHNSRSYPHHAQHPDCIADFTKTVDGLTGEEHITPGIKAFLRSRGQTGWSIQLRQWGQFSFSDIVRQIDAGRPVLGIADFGRRGLADHAVVIVGYNTKTQKYAAYDAIRPKLRWFAYHGVESGRRYGLGNVGFIAPG